MKPSQIAHFQEWNQLFQIRIVVQKVREHATKALFFTKCAHSAFTRNDLQMRQTLKPSRERLQELNEKLGLAFGAIQVVINMHGIAGVPPKFSIDPLIEWKTNPNYASGSYQSNERPIVGRLAEGEKLLLLPMPQESIFKRNINAD